MQANKDEDIEQEKIELYKSRIIAFEKAHTRRETTEKVTKIKIDI